MNIGDLVRSIIPPRPRLAGQCYAGIILRWNGRCGAMVLWENGEVVYSPLDELEVISESR